MAFYWNPYHLPELKDLPKQQRKAIWKNAWKRAGNRWQIVVAMLLFVTSVCVGEELLDHYKYQYPLVLRMLFSGIGVFLAQSVYTHCTTCFLRPLIWEQIPGLCPGCGYDIRATPNRCPECGHIFAESESST